MSLFMSLSPFLQGLLLPGFLLYDAIAAYVKVLINGILQNGSIPKDLRGQAFSVFWNKLSGERPDPNVPLVGSATLIPPLLAQARGVVLDVGPGSGNLTGYFDDVQGNISKIYGAEPAVGLHRTLRRNVDTTKVGPKYVVMNAAATKESILQGLSQAGVRFSRDDSTEIFDTIICVRVLCSVPDLRTTISDLHSLLKPGGKLLVCEHTANAWRTPKGSLIARVVQTMYSLVGWSYFAGDCSLTRDIEDELRRDSDSRWSNIDIERHFGKAVLTYIAGVLEKVER